MKWVFLMAERGWVLSFLKKNKNVIVKPHPLAAPCHVPFGWFVLRVWFESGGGGQGEGWGRRLQPCLCVTAGSLLRGWRLIMCVFPGKRRKFTLALGLALVVY